MYKYLDRVCKEAAWLFQHCPATAEVPSKPQEALLYCVGDRALEQVAQRGYRVSLLRDLKQPPGHGAGQPALGGLP